MATITFRPDDESARALAALTADGTSASAAIREALIHEAQRHEEARLRAEAIALARDPTDAAEARQVLADLEPLRAW
ncbi:MAG: antitoxin [Pseudonocardiaceae bacterium]